MAVALINPRHNNNGFNPDNCLIFVYINVSLFSKDIGAGPKNARLFVVTYFFLKLPINFLKITTTTF
jgi:hypothetical protein